ncbi:ubiquitin carboxy-terminal hydrolase (macronuclear) [Tetrahymena thermophila SB210]|uniref:Ubiquitin carboxy-terminal hydrolase n=1 Tax=Tetrahymena thermophila (strain SB210) TaxID=312017 RepID=Q238S9_TETTS|nr:ubiquitin carboxy-terminal hydrolase [Tetrahymena thermophila SB210]EAR93141.2 ubiquitin carboxy-terminal hydrolase [Tetrahymena thermophila SB210]|eukprot:XP_001013386.2 ubiquitin carboxy-terminal hydrolase [Tetrahymena thermophila SB210]
MRNNKNNSYKNKYKTDQKSTGFKNQTEHKLIETQSQNKIKNEEIEEDYEQEEESKQEYNKVTVGFKNIGNTCYLNTALQTIRQISCISRDSLPNTDFCKTLKLFILKHKLQSQNRIAKPNV